MTLAVVISTPQEIIFKGQANSVILPGERGTFEVLAFHKPCLSRLIAGKVSIDGKSFDIIRGAARIFRNNLTLIVEVP